MISDFAASLFGVSLVLVLIFTIWILRSRKQHYLMHRLYLCMLWDFALWAVVMLAMWRTHPDQTHTLQILDSLTYLGIAVPPFYFMISYTFTHSATRFPKWGYLLFVVPVLSTFIGLTNEWHHLQYKVFSVIRSEIVFGPYLAVTGAHSYLCLIGSAALLIRFAIRNPTKLYIRQCAMLVLGGLIPLAVSIYATFSGKEVSIAATPQSFMFLLIFNGIAIYALNLLDITPVATQHVLDWIPDCYLILNKNGLVVSYNKRFSSVFASQYGIVINKRLKDCMKDDDISQKNVIRSILNAVDSCRDAQSTISYEQSAVVEHDGIVQKNYYVADVSQLVINDNLAGFVVIFKDITQLKKSMQQLQDNQNP